MKILRKTLIFIMVTVITVVLTSRIKFNTFASSTLICNNRNIVKAGVVLRSFNNPYRAILKQSLEEIQKKNEDKVKFTFFDGKDNIAIQYELLDNLLKSDVDFLVVDLVDVRENIVEDIIYKFKSKNTSLIFANIDPLIASKFTKFDNKVVFMNVDFKQACIQQGKIIVDAWQNNKEVIDKNSDNILQYIMLKGELDNPIAIARSIYSISTINDAGIKTQELSSVNANWDEDLAKNAIKSLFLRYDDKIEAIIANNDTMAIGAIEALQEYGYNKGNKTITIPVVGIDGLQEAKDLIDKGIMTGTVIQEPNVLAEAIYNVGMNLVKNVDSVKDTNYQVSDGEIIITIPNVQYINKANVS